MARKAAIITAYDPYLFKGGIETYTLQLISLLEVKGIEVTVYHMGLANNKQAAFSTNLYNKFLEDIYYIGRKLLNDENQYEFIIANSFYGMCYFPPAVKTFNIYHSVYAAYIQKYKDKYSDDPYFNFMFLSEEVGQYISGHKRIKIAVSDEVKKELESIYGFKDVKVVYNGVDTSKFKKEENREYLRQRLGISREAFVGIFVGRWENIQKRNKVMESVILKRLDIHWLLVLGTGSDECQLKDNPNVVIRKNIPIGDMPWMYSVADFMLFPSSYEGFGMVVVEAMTCGLPVITTNVGIVPSIYNDEPFSFLLLPEMIDRDEKSLEIINHKIDLLKEDQKLRREIGEKGSQLVRERFSLDRWKEDMEVVLGI